MSVSDEEREEILEGLWAEGGFKFLWGGFIDLLRRSRGQRDRVGVHPQQDPRDGEGSTDGRAALPQGLSLRSEAAADRHRLLRDVQPRQHEPRRHQRCARSRQSLRRGCAPTTAEYEFDSIVFATGFDAITGPLLRMDIRGTGGVRLADAWSDGPRTLLGLQVARFPNMFTITGPGSPSVLLNMPVAIEHHVDWIADCLDYMREQGWTRIEATESAQDAWAEHVADLGRESLYVRANSWYVGANIPGKPRGGVALHGRSTHVPRPLRRGQGVRIRGLRVRRGA